MTKMPAASITRQIAQPGSLPHPPAIPPNDPLKHINLRRRHVLVALTVSFNFNVPFTTLLPIAEPVAAARGLFQMPPFRLSNR